MFFYRLCHILSYLPLHICYPTKVIGKKNVPKKGASIMCCNHRSNMDAVVIDTNYYRRPYVLAKHTLFEKKFVGAVLKSYGGIPVNREQVGAHSIKMALDALKKGERLLLFPEGTRKDISDEENLSLKNGSAMFAIKSQAPVVPMWLIKKPKAFQKNVLLVGEPFVLSEFAGQKLSKEILEQASQIISQKMQKLRDDYIKEQEEKEAKKKNKKSKNKSKNGVEKKED